MIVHFSQFFHLSFDFNFPLDTQIQTAWNDCVSEPSFDGFFLTSGVTWVYILKGGRLRSSASIVYSYYFNFERNDKKKTFENEFKRTRNPYYYFSVYNNVPIIIFGSFSLHLKIVLRKLKKIKIPTGTNFFLSRNSTQLNNLL